MDFFLGNTSLTGSSSTSISGNYTLGTITR